MAVYRLLLAALLLGFAPWTASAAPLTIAGFGDSITCDTCNDGSYLQLIHNYLPEVPIIDDNGESSDVTSKVESRLEDWLIAGNTADVVILLSGTPDTYRVVGGFGNQDYDEAATLANIEDMIDLVIGAGLPLIVGAPPAVQPPCGNPDAPLTCTDIDSRLASLATEIGILAGSKSVPFVDLYDAYVNHPDFGATPGSAASLFGTDGLHPKLATGDDLNAMLFAQAIQGQIIPEPSTLLLVGSGLLLMSGARRRL